MSRKSIAEKDHHYPNKNRENGLSNGFAEAILNDFRGGNDWLNAKRPA